MNETEFHALADATLAAWLDALDDADASGALEAENHQGALTIALPTGSEWIVSKHAPTRQLWLSSPLSGGLHFSWNASEKQWSLTDGRTLSGILSAELQASAKIAIEI